MAELVDFPGETVVDLPAEKVLTRAVNVDLTEVVVIGTDPNGDLYFASTTSDCPRVLWLLELARQDLLEIASDD